MHRDDAYRIQGKDHINLHYIVGTSYMFLLNFHSYYKYRPYIKAQWNCRGCFYEKKLVEERNRVSGISTKF